MRSSFTPEEVDQIEEKAYEVGERIGRRLERERIVALLKQHLCTFTDTEIVECWCGSFNEAIALIKGETK